jgi:HK97 family phage prohead protease
MRKKRFEFKATTKGDSLVIEGFANKAIVDSAGDLMAYDNVDLKRFNKNPILFFNHDRDKPIGKVLETKMSDAGMWVKAQLSNSSNELVQYVRDLVQEGILKTFSIGFDAKNEQKKEGVNVIDAWEMLELSVVTLPCNIDSEFSLSKRKMLMRVKGALVAEVLSQYTMTEEQVAALAEKLEMELSAIAAVMAGDVTPVPAPFIAAVKEILALSEEQAAELDAAVAKESEPAEEEEMPAEELAKKPDDEEVEKEEGEPNDFQTFAAQRIPALVADGMSLEEAIAAAFKEGMSKEKTKQEMPTFPIPDKPQETEFGNPVIELMKSQLAMFGAMLTELKGLNAYLASIVQAPLAMEPKPLQNDTSTEQLQDDEAKAFLIAQRLKELL